jgi:glucose-6-phosphate 1-dehydrogenase
MIVFGGNGDLALRKLMPALYHLERDGRIPEGSRIIGTARSDLTREDYLIRVRDSMQRFLPAKEFDPGLWERFAPRLSYLRTDGGDRTSFSQLASDLGDGSQRDRIYYFSVAPGLFAPIAANLDAVGLVSPRSRVVLEKPLGHDLRSSREINDAIGRVFAEEQTYRIDHYLGKEAVQNLLILRFANVLFEPIWSRAYVDHVQITVAESLGVEGRWGYYDGAGALRDMVQNHLLQLLCLVAMEPPSKMDKDAVRDEKLKVLTALKPLPEAQVEKVSVRGQYRAGLIDGAAVPGYSGESGAVEGSLTETFVALRAEIDNWRWAGVPFYLRTGKRLPERLSEIVMQFRDVPHLIFEGAKEVVKPNRLVIRLQPDEGVRVMMMNKMPGPGPLPSRLQQAPLNLSFSAIFDGRQPDAYERLLFDVIRGNPTLFMRRDEVDAAWSWVDAIIEAWAGKHDAPKGYAAGTWGPSAAVAMIERDGRTWHEDMH